MADRNLITAAAGAELRWNNGHVVHKVLGTHHDGVAFYRTLCNQDVPEGALLDEERPVTCFECLGNVT